MLKHFHLGRRAYFPAIFLGAVLLGMVGFAIWLELCGASAVSLTKNAFELFLTFVGAVGAFVYFLYGQHHQDTQMFVSLFEKFNARYDKLNEKLNAIIRRPNATPLGTEQKDTLYDYFNLCAEEHLFYVSGYIDEEVWQAWLRGMQEFAKDPEVKRFWEAEINLGSYYHFRTALLNTHEPRP
jgi:hypothetical protein